MSRYPVNRYAKSIEVKGKRFEYDQDNRLERCYEEGALAGEYTYNGLGQRVAKTVEGVTTLFVYDQDGRLILETEAGAEGAGREYLHRGDNRLAMYDMAGDAWYFFQNDPIGTPVAVTDEENRIVWEAVYLPCGEAAVNPASLIEFNLRFAGQYYDAETGLHYNYHRYYDPRTGRYLTPDPIGLDGGINLYAYVQNNPVNYSDSQGLEAKDIIPGVIKAGKGILNAFGNDKLQKGTLWGFNQAAKIAVGVHSFSALKGTLIYNVANTPTFSIRGLGVAIRNAIVDPLVDAYGPLPASTGFGGLIFIIDRYIKPWMLEGWDGPKYCEE